MTKNLQDIFDKDSPSKFKTYSNQTRAQMSQSKNDPKNKKNISRKLKDKWQSGNFDHICTQLQTPLGQFNSIREAAQAHKCHTNTIFYRLKTKPDLYWRIK